MGIMTGGGGVLGSFLLFAAFVILLVSTISSPIVRQISFLDVYDGAARTTFGVFGYCSPAACQRHLGYNLPDAVATFDGAVWPNDNIDDWTRVLILHPVATSLAFIAFIFALFSHILGCLTVTTAALAFIVSLFTTAIDFAIFTVVRNEVNDRGGADVSATYGHAIWLSLAATVILFCSIFTVSLSCRAARRERLAGD